MYGSVLARARMHAHRTQVPHLTVGGPPSTVREFVEGGEGNGARVAAT